MEQHSDILKIDEKGMVFTEGQEQICLICS